jgi:hypothetical protein
VPIDLVALASEAGWLPTQVFFFVADTALLEVFFLPIDLVALASEAGWLQAKVLK